MDILEHELESLIEQMWEIDTGETLSERGLEISPLGKMQRQFRIEGLGVADLVSCSYDVVPNENGGADYHLYFQVTELKRDKIGYDALGQVCSYIDNIEKGLDLLKVAPPNTIECSIQGILVGKSIDESSNFLYALSHSDIEAYTYTIDSIKGLSFNNVGGSWSARSLDRAKLQQALHDFINLPSK